MRLILHGIFYALSKETFLLRFWLYFLHSFLDLACAQAACDCETECSCSKSNCTAGQYWLCDGGCVDCPAGHL